VLGTASLDAKVYSVSLSGKSASSLRTEGSAAAAHRSMSSGSEKVSKVSDDVFPRPLL
jgi:hypothetical protein